MRTRPNLGSSGSHRCGQKSEGSSEWLHVLRDPPRSPWTYNRFSAKDSNKEIIDIIRTNTKSTIGSGGS